MKAALRRRMGRFWWMKIGHEKTLQPGKTTVFCNGILGSIKGLASSVREGLVLLCFALVKSHLEYRIQAWGCNVGKTWSC